MLGWGRLWFLFLKTYTDEQTDRQCRSAGRQVEKHTELEFLNDLRGPGTE
jgi:hypothetical protein